MFYLTSDKAGYRLNQSTPLNSNPFKACIVPRPIAWITTISNTEVVNLAPFSYFNAVCDNYVCSRK